MFLNTKLYLENHYYKNENVPKAFKKAFGNIVI